MPDIIREIHFRRMAKILGRPILEDFHNDMRIIIADLKRDKLAKEEMQAALTTEYNKRQGINDNPIN